MLDLDGITISHFIPGRVRIRVQQLKKNEKLARKVREFASGLDLVENIEVNTLIGSVLLEYDPGEKDEIKKLLQQAKQFNFIPEDIELEEIHAILDGEKSPGSLSVYSDNFSEQARVFFSRLNDEVENLTGKRTNLNELIPLGLFGMGLRSLMVAETLAGPPWHTYFWYAFSTFLILNPSENDKSNDQQKHAATG